MSGLIIAGSRALALTADAIDRALIDMWDGAMPTRVLCGNARGVDTAGAEWARRNGVPIDYFLADWDLHGRKAGPIRNAKMADAADALIAFWDGKSRGTADMITRMRRLGKPARVYDYDGSRL